MFKNTITIFSEENYAGRNPEELMRDLLLVVDETEDIFGNVGSQSISEEEMLNDPAFPEEFFD